MKVKRLFLIMLVVAAINTYGCRGTLQNITEADPLQQWKFAVETHTELMSLAMSYNEAGTMSDDELLEFYEVSLGVRAALGIWKSAIVSDGNVSEAEQKYEEKQSELINILFGGSNGHGTDDGDI